MSIMGWTSFQYETENTKEDLARLVLYKEKLEQVEEVKRKKEELKQKGQFSVGGGTKRNIRR